MHDLRDSIPRHSELSIGTVCHNRDTGAPRTSEDLWDDAQAQLPLIERLVDSAIAKGRQHPQDRADLIATGTLLAYELALRRPRDLTTLLAYTLRHRLIPRAGVDASDHVADCELIADIPPGNHGSKKVIARALTGIPVVPEAPMVLEDAIARLPGAFAPIARKAFVDRQNIGYIARTTGRHPRQLLGHVRKLSNVLTALTGKHFQFNPDLRWNAGVTGPHGASMTPTTDLIDKLFSETKEDAERPVVMATVDFHDHRPCIVLPLEIPATMLRQVKNGTSHELVIRVEAKPIDIVLVRETPDGPRPRTFTTRPVRFDLKVAQ